MASEAQKRAVERYDRDNTIQIHLKLNKNTDADILERLQWAADVGIGKQGYIKALIRKDIE